MGKYFNIKFRPDIVNGDISDVIDSDKTDKPFAANDVLFDWQTVQMPKGGGRLLGVTMVINGEDGVAQAARDIELLFARSVNGVAPTTIGVPNATASSLNIQNHIVGALTMDKEYGVTGTDSCNILSTISGGADQAGMPTIILEGEPSTTTGYTAGYDTIYVAGITSGALDFSTGVLSTEAIDASSAEKTTIAVDTVDARLVFSPGDKVYVHDVDTQIPGTVKTVGQNLLTFDTTNSTVDVANNDELINATPIKIILHCEK
tara:strand:- start:46 stop:828 length:783 start_codon:yes stop_codon:yes gene_type:complete